MTLTGDASPLVLAQRYRVGERIGAGSMGAVWQATDELLGRIVAVKQLLLQPGLPGFDSQGYEEAKQRMLREGRLAARLQHPHTVSVFDVVLHDDSPWLVMEYMPSRTLGALLDAEGPIEPRRAAGIGTQIADGLAAAHAAGIVHRDIKPGNVLIGVDGNVKITDFGVSRAVDDVQITRTGMIAGTPAFLAPEIARGRTPTSASDVFALGSTLYAAVEGLPPFGLDENAYALLYAVGEGKVNPPVRAGELAEPLMRMLRKEPTERPTATRVRDELAAVAAGEPVAVSHIGPGTAVRLSAAGQPRPVAGTAAAAEAPEAPAGAAEAPAPTRTKVDTAPLPVTEPAMAPSGIAAPGAGQDRSDGLGVSDRPAVPRRPATPQPAARPGPSWARRGLSRRAGILAGVLVLVLLAAVLLLSQGRGNPVGGGAPSTSAAPGAAASPQRPQISGRPSAAQLEDFVRDYYGLLPGNPSAAWQLLSPTAQSASNGFASYQSFYRGLSAITFAEGPTAVDSRTVRATLRFQEKSGTTSTERYSFTVAPGPDGKLIMSSFSKG
jgi:hypothetical protein